MSLSLAMGWVRHIHPTAWQPSKPWWNFSCPSSHVILTRSGPTALLSGCDGAWVAVTRAKSCLETCCQGKITWVSFLGAYAVVFSLSKERGKRQKALLLTRIFYFSKPSKLRKASYSAVCSVIFSLTHDDIGKLMQLEEIHFFFFFFRWF